jgi:hypothetical protein
LLRATCDDYSSFFFQEMQAVANIEDVEMFMLKHGECIVDVLGGEVDRIEKNLKVSSNQRS